MGIKRQKDEKPAKAEKKAAPKGECVCHAAVEELSARIATLESVFKLELGIDPSTHAASLVKTPGGPAGDAGSR